MTREGVEKKLRERIVENFGIFEIEQIKPDSRFSEDLGLDSLDIVELVMWTESIFEISLEDERLDNIQTFQEYLEYLYEVIKI